MIAPAETEFRQQLPFLLKAFGLSAHFDFKTLDSGHINHSYVLLSAETPVWVLQRINTRVFSNPPAIAQNWKRAWKHIQSVDKQYKMLMFVPAADGNDYAITPDGSYWRLMPFVNHSVCYTKVTETCIAKEAVHAFGRFGALLATANPCDFSVILNNFHNVSYRKLQLTQSLKDAEPNRLKQAKPILERLEKFDWIEQYFVKIQAKLPLRIVHMDAKISNVLFDANGKVLNIIDFDTLMPGTLLSDAGDLVRSMACDAAEDETDPEKVKVNTGLVEAMLEAYRSEVLTIATPFEISNLPFGALMLVYMQSMRFIADFLQQDSYYQISYPEQNLRRAYSQLLILEQLRKMPAFSDFAS